MPTPQFSIGDRVKLTAKALQSMGLRSRHVWTITGFDGPWAITDQPLSAGSRALYTDAELASDPTLAFRRIAVAALRMA